MAQSKRKSAPKKVAKTEETASPQSAKTTDTTTTDDLDGLLDEIDTVLEPDAEAFVQGYIQKGGE
jgi:prokaryotic ubiquitin-like protein Pup